MKHEYDVIIRLRMFKQIQIFVVTTEKIEPKKIFIMCVLSIFTLSNIP